MSADDARLPALQAELQALADEAAAWANVESSGSTAMVHVSDTDPERLREQMIATRREAHEKANQLQAAATKVRAEIQSELDRQRAEMQAKMHQAMEALAPLQAQVKRLEEGVWTIGLYLGAAEEIVTLREGAPTSITTPLTLRTTVLAMDEEVAAFPVEEDGKVDWQGMDFRDIETFDRWLTEDPKHLDQVLPEPRGIVVFTPRRNPKQYDENPLLNAVMNQDNFESYWLIRNGENLYRLKADFLVGLNLMPTTSEFTALFQTRRYNHVTREHEMIEIIPGTREWEQAEKDQDARRRHYMRVALIIQGLIDRTTMFHPIHAAVNVMRQGTYDDGLIVVINDTERTLTTSREPYADWIKRLNRDLRPGMRLIGNFRAEGFLDYYNDWRTDRDDTSRNKRLSPPNAEYPDSNVIHYIEGRKDGGFVIRYQRTQKVYDPKMWVPSETRPGWGHDGGYRLPTTRASAVIKPDDTFVIPYDLVTEDEMQTYLGARTERHAYAEMFPLLQAAIAAKRDEAAAEAPFRDLLTRILAEDNDQTPEDVEPHLAALVHRYKLGNKWHRPLVSLSPEDEAKAIRLVRAEYKRIVNSGATEARDAHALAVLRDADPDIMFVGRLSSGKYVAFSPQPRVYSDGVVAQNLWVREHATTKTAASITTREWVIPGARGRKMTEIFCDDRWPGWDTGSTSKDDLTDAEFASLAAQAKDEAMALLRGQEGQDVEFLALGHNPAARTFAVFVTDSPSRVPTRVKASGFERHHSWHAAGARWTRDQAGTPALNPLSARNTQTGKWAREYIPFIRPGDPVAIRPTERPAERPWSKALHLFDHSETYRPADIDQAALAAAEAAFAAFRESNKVRSQLVAQVYSTLSWIERQQIDLKVKIIKAKFLTEYPDPEMWEERRNQLTKGVKADIEVSNGWHFPDKGSRRGENPDSLRLDHALERLIDSGTLEWDGLSIAHAYRLIDAPMPEIYTPIEWLTLLAEPSATRD